MIRPSWGQKEHLHFVLNDPANFDGYAQATCVLVSATTIHAPKFDASCILEPGCHPFITGRSYVAYNYSRIATAAELEQAVQNGIFRDQQPVDEAFIRRLVACMLNSPRTPGEYKKLARRVWDSF